MCEIADEIDCKVYAKYSAVGGFGPELSLALLPDLYHPHWQFLDLPIHVFIMTRIAHSCAAPMPTRKKQKVDVKVKLLVRLQSTECAHFDRKSIQKNV